MFSRDLKALNEIDFSHNEIAVFSMDAAVDENQGIQFKNF